mmetsp:Transcript_15545/g.33869  ORF Transcript_15545/g.33869 Transcript_15545/m.33869 type:complete len:310 (-) Transcript_15545:1714-2643(-)|eukprot:CAMPEP_0168782314 /NCGR_PEP_ID=MMETSP0725-20121227/9101_1 /TAXON_ID=265536 /ORGANISM="Amphiprora sp., Strain CCMP467" /LENGTH=309 /DNA_ID=CAMNT_0008832245 /DNA_START=66 /DNA_END=995 /DNA_ORIENTATION=+
MMKIQADNRKGRRQSVSARVFLRKNMAADQVSVASTVSTPSTDDEEVQSLASSSTLSSSTSQLSPTLKSSQSVLIVGAGQTGVETLRKLSDPSNNDKPIIYGLTRNFKTTAKETMDEFKIHAEALIEGDPTCAADIHRALLISNADTIIVTVGTGRKLKQSNVRTANGEAIAQVLRHPPFHHVRVIVVSWTSSARVKYGVGIGKLLERKSVEQDHQGQEQALTADHRIGARTTIVRPTALTRIGKKRSATTLQLFADGAKTPKLPTNRKDLAGWLSKEVLQPSHVGDVVNVASVRQYRGQVARHKSQLQ